MITKEGLQSTEFEKRLNIGAATLIINQSGKLYAVKEKKESPDTERLPGQVGITTERSKVGESSRSNLLGALGEFCSDKDIPSIMNHLFTVGLPKTIDVDLSGKLLSCTLYTLVYDVNIQPTPADHDEVDPHGWIYPQEIVSLPILRPLSGQILREVAKKRLIEEGLENYRKDRKFFALDGFGPSRSFDEFIRGRNLLLDSYMNGVGTNTAKRIVV